MNLFCNQLKLHHLLVQSQNKNNESLSIHFSYKAPVVITLIKTSQINKTLEEILQTFF